MATLTAEAKSSIASIAEVDFLFSDLSDFVFSDSTDFVFSELASGFSGTTKNASTFTSETKN